MKPGGGKLGTENFPKKKIRRGKKIKIKNGEKTKAS